MFLDFILPISNCQIGLNSVVVRNNGLGQEKCWARSPGKGERAASISGILTATCSNWPRLGSGVWIG